MCWWSLGPDRLGAGQPSHDRCERLRRFAWHHDVAESPSFATLDQPLAEFVHGSDEHNG